VARLYVDEDLGIDVVQGLRTLGHEVEYSLDLGHAQRRDALHLRYAASQQLILLTGNREDFRYLHRLWSCLADWALLADPHAGILTASRRPATADWNNAIDQPVTDTDNLSGQFYTWQVSTGTGTPIGSPAHTSTGWWYGCTALAGSQAGHTLGAGLSTRPAVYSESRCVYS
jgi:hypothetical protein